MKRTLCLHIFGYFSLSSLVIRCAGPIASYLQQLVIDTFRIHAEPRVVSGAAVPTLRGDDSADELTSGQCLSVSVSALSPHVSRMFKSNQIRSPPARCRVSFQRRAAPNSQTSDISVACLPVNVCSLALSKHLYTDSRIIKEKRKQK
jgi:hypothetical protein